jgi:hypothetical protein
MDRLPPLVTSAPTEPSVHTMIKEHIGERVHALKIS